MSKTFDTKSYLAALEELIHREVKSGRFAVANTDTALVEVACRGHEARLTQAESRSKEHDLEIAKAAWLLDCPVPRDSSDPLSSSVLPSLREWMSSRALALRTENVLTRNLVSMDHSLANLVCTPIEDVREWIGCGMRTLSELQEVLASQGMYLGMSLEEVEAAYKTSKGET